MLGVGCLDGAASIPHSSCSLASATPYLSGLLIISMLNSTQSTHTQPPTPTTILPHSAGVLPHRMHFRAKPSVSISTKAIGCSIVQPQCGQFICSPLAMQNQRSQRLQSRLATQWSTLYGVRDLELFSCVIGFGLENVRQSNRVVSRILSQASSRADFVNCQPWAAHGQGRPLVEEHVTWQLSP